MNKKAFIALYDPPPQPWVIRFLDAFWLSKDEYESLWLPIEKVIFADVNSVFPESFFNKNYDVFITQGGPVFDRKQLISFYEIMVQLKEEYIIVVEKGNTWDSCIGLKIPINTMWDDLRKGGLLFSMIFRFPTLDFHAFGSSGQWGRIIANEHEYPLQFLGCKPEIAHLFQQFRVTEEYKQGILPYIPLSYPHRE